MATTYSGADTADDVAWHTGNAQSETHVVAGKAANELGAYDMSGNIREWVLDWYYTAYYTADLVTDPTGPENGSIKGIRGGSWNQSAEMCTVTARDAGDPTGAAADLGFRVVFSSGASE